MIKAVDSFLTTLKTHNIPHDLGDPPGKALMLRAMLQYIGTTRDESGRITRAMRLSAGGRYVQQAHNFVNYLTEIVKLAGRIGAQQERTISQLQAESDALGLEKRVLALYEEILELLGVPAPSAQPQEVQQ